MIEKIEISDLDLRYESYRMKNYNEEKHLLNSICCKGIEESLLGITTIKNEKILLDGFKRIRCAKKLNIKIVSFLSISANELDGIIYLIRKSNSKKLNIIEQANLVNDLYIKHKMTITQISNRLEKSKSWVSLRINVMKNITPKAKEKIIAGEFPLYSYMYTIQQFIRINKVPKKEVDEFIDSVSEKGFSIRDIEALANCFFRGGSEVKEQIIKGNTDFLLRKKNSAREGYNQKEQSFINDLEIVRKYMERVVFSIKEKYTKPAFFAEANLLVEGILEKLEIFKKSLREFYDKTGKTTGNMGTIPGGNENKKNF